MRVILKILDWIEPILIVAIAICAMAGLLLGVSLLFGCSSEKPIQIQRVDSVIEKMDLTRKDTPEWHETRAALAECRAALRACMIHRADPVR